MDKIVILKNDEVEVLVDPSIDRTSGHFPVTLRNIDTGKEREVPDVQIIFKWGEWEEVAPSEKEVGIIKITFSKGDANEADN